MTSAVCGERDERAEHPVPVEEPLVALRAPDEARAEDGALVQVRQAQVGGDRRPPQQRGEDDPDRGADGYGRASNDASRGHLGRAR